MAVVLAANAPWSLRAAMLLVLPLVLPSMFEFVLLRGNRAIRVLEWNWQGEYHLGIGPGRRRLAARLTGHQKLGFGLRVLVFQSAEGRFRLLLDTGLQHRVQVCGLGRALERGDLITSRPKV